MSIDWRSDRTGKAYDYYQLHGITLRLEVGNPLSPSTHDHQLKRLYFSYIYMKLTGVNQTPAEVLDNHNNPLLPQGSHGSLVKRQRDASNDTWCQQQRTPDFNFFMMSTTLYSTALHNRNTVLLTTIYAFHVTCVTRSEFFNLYPTGSKMNLYNYSRYWSVESILSS